MALIRVTEESLRGLVDDAVFGQAQDWADKVTGLRVDGLLVEASVDGVATGFLVHRHGLEGRCGCPLPAPCAHVIATALAWVRAVGEDESPPDLLEVLRTQDRDWLASQLAELAAADPALAARLLDEAEDVAALDEVADLRDEFDEMLDEMDDEARDQRDYDEWDPNADGLHELFDEAEALADDAPRALRSLARHLIERIERILSYENCYGDSMTGALARCRELAQGHD